MPHPFSLVDVFAEAPFTGNPLAVVHDAEGLSADEMHRITRWLNLSETTFLLPPTTDEADYRVRIFTLDRELPFAGHPTLGSCHAWLEAGGQPHHDGEIIQECGAGLVRIRQQEERLAFAAPPRIRTGPVSDEKLAEIAEVLRIDRSQIVATEWVDNGPGWVGVLLVSAEEVLALDPLRSYPSRVEIGVVGPYPEGESAAFELRALFSDHHGTLLEDPVTGSLNASVAQWLLESGRATAPYIASQGERVGRAGRIYISQSENDVWVGGRALTLFRGEAVI